MNAQYEAPTEADAEWADAIIFGTPTRFGNVSSELKAWVDSLGGLWFQGKLNGKVGSVFVSTSPACTAATRVPASPPTTSWRIWA